MRLPRLLAIAAVTTLALGTAACASDEAAEPEASTPAPSQSIDTSGAPDASPSPSAEPEPTASETTPEPTSDDDQGSSDVVAAPYEPLDADPAGTIARADLAILDGAPSSSSTVVGAVVSGQTFVVEGQCTGGPSMGFRLDRAVGGTPEERLLLEGTLACDAAPSQGYALSAPYDGPAQLSITAADGVTQAWIVARSQ